MIQKLVRAGIITAVFLLVVTSFPSQQPVMAHIPINSGKLPSFKQRFLDLYNKIKSPSSGYFSPQGIPYHSVETLMAEAPDYGHETTSETFSYWIWLEASYGKVTGNWQPFNKAWVTMEKYMIPSHQDQPTNSGYNPSKPATYAPEHNEPSQYPSKLQPSVSVGQDPLYSELKQTYNTSDVYGMHWLLDTDNWYGYGHCGDHTSKPSYINTFQRGAQESVWKTVPQPSCDTFSFGGKNGFLDLFTGDSSYAKQWRYTDAPTRMPASFRPPTGPTLGLKRAARRQLSPLLLPKLQRWAITFVMRSLTNTSRKWAVQARVVRLALAKIAPLTCYRGTMLGAVHSLHPAHGHGELAQALLTLDIEIP